MSYNDLTLHIRFSESPESPVMGERIQIAAAGYGRKGLVDENVLAGISKFCRPGWLADIGDHIHWKDGLLVGWDPDYGQMKW